jgi:hypothetical protein
VPTIQARAKLTLNANALWYAPGVNIRAQAKLALNANAKGRARATGKLALRANALWREPATPSKARGRLALNANAAGPSAQAWPNGFVGQIEVRLEAVAGGGTVTNALYPLTLTDPALATAATDDDPGNGGLSLNAGFDVQIETAAGAVLGYVRLGYQATGAWVGLVNLPSRNFAVDESIFVYVGKAVTDGQNATLARAGGWLGWWGGTGADLTGQLRDLVEHSGVTVNDVLGDLPAIGFDGDDDYLDQAGSSYLNGLTAITAFQVYEPDFQNQTRELWNVSVGTAGELGFRFRTVDADGTKPRRIVAIAKFGASVLQLESADNTAPGTSTPVPTLPPSNTTPPAISPSSGLAVGSGVTVGDGKWTNSPTGFTYRWQQDAADIPGATAKSYTLLAAQSGKMIRCGVVASNGAGSGTEAFSTAVGPVVAAAASPFVQVYPSPFDDTTGKTIKKPGVGGVAAFNVNTGNNFPINADEIWDLRGLTATVHENANSASSFNCNNGPASSVVCGGKSTSSNVRYFGTTAGASWKDIHGDTTTGGGASGNYASLYFNGPCAKGFRAHGFYCKRTIDGMVPKDNSQGCIVENSVFTEIRDDCIQDDSQNDFTFRGCYLQGHVIFSWRPGGGSPAGKSGRIMTVRKTLIHLDRQMYLGEDTAGDSGSKRADKYVDPTHRNNTIVHPGAGMGSKWLHKTHSTGDAGGLKIRYDMEDVLIRIDTPSVDGISAGEMFPNTADGVGVGSVNGSRYVDVHVVWLGPNYATTGAPVAWDTVFAATGQTKASLLAMGITIHDGGAGGSSEQDALDYWNLHKAAFMTAHGYDAGTDTFSWNRP